MKNLLIFWVMDMILYGFIGEAIMVYPENVKIITMIGMVTAQIIASEYVREGQNQYHS